ncbi:rRNA maturation RNase YbeY [Gammaproteobacteria bacterium 45_16_T64]|nr:rRNA maturation RNase YbeY [Gammaproteobacteria bacterium 45_16_T64]
MSDPIDLAFQNPDNLTICPTQEDFLCWTITATNAARTYTQALTDDQQEPFELTIRIASQDEARTLNSTYRNKDYPTNVLSFPFEAPAEVDINLLGDIVICADIVIDEAKQQNKSLQSHWAHLTIHGTLHLLGFDHIDDADAETMEAIEVNAMAMLGFANPYKDITISA